MEVADDDAVSPEDTLSPLPFSDRRSVSMGSRPTINNLRQSLQNLHHAPSRYTLHKKHYTLKNFNLKATKDEMAMDGMKAQLEETMEMLKSKEDDLKLASEIGTLLVERNEEATEKVSFLEGKLEQLEHELDLAATRERDLKSELKAQKKEQLKMQYTNEDLEEQLHGLREQNADDSKRLEKLEDSIQKVEGNAEFTLMELHKKVSDLEAERDSLAKSKSRLTKQTESQEEELLDLRAELVNAEKQLEHLRGVESKCAELETKANQRDSLTSEVEDLRWENKQLSRTVQSAQEEISRLSSQMERDHETLQHMKEDRQRQSGGSDGFLSPIPTPSPPPSSSPTQSSGNVVSARDSIAETLGFMSLASELTNMNEEEKEKRKKQEADAMKEFFYLTALSVKMNIGMQLQVYFQRSTRELYKQALEEGIAFHDFSNWIESQYMKDYVEATCSKDNTENVQQMEKEEEKLPFWRRWFRMSGSTKN